jgi:hypothetical protein
LTNCGIEPFDDFALNSLLGSIQPSDRQVFNLENRLLAHAVALDASFLQEIDLLPHQTRRPEPPCTQSW